LSDYLSKTNSVWKSSMGRGTSLRWQVGIAAKGNEGVAGMVKQTPFSFGYVELVYAVQTRLTYGRVRNAAGRFIKADLASIRAAAAASASSMPDDFRISITDAPGRDAYPMASYTWLLTPAHIPDPVKKRIIVDFLRWMVLHGQRMAEELGYARLPDGVAPKVLKACDRIQ
jgi:phosphate transport system substrate-binding protein